MPLYPTRFSDNSLKICDFILKLTRFVIGFSGPTTWNTFLKERKKSYANKQDERKFFKFF